jgi:hypothetical protein
MYGILVKTNPARPPRMAILVVNFTCIFKHGVIN